MQQPEKENAVVTRRGSFVRVAVLSCTLLLGTSLAVAAAGPALSSAKANGMHPQISHAKNASHDEGPNDQDQEQESSKDVSNIHHFDSDEKGGPGFDEKGGPGFDEKGGFDGKDSGSGFFDEKGGFDEGRFGHRFFDRCDRRDFEGRDGFPFFFGDDGRRSEHRFIDRVNRPTDCSFDFERKDVKQKAHEEQAQKQDVEVKQNVHVRVELKERPVKQFFAAPAMPPTGSDPMGHPLP